MNYEEINPNSNIFDDLFPNAEIVECERLYAKAEQAYELKKISKAVKFLTKIIKLSPQFGKAFSFLGKIYKNNYQDYEQAEKYYLACVKASPKYRLGWMNYFYFLRTANRFEEAKQAIEKWSNLGVDAETVNYEYGYLFEVQGEIKQAIRCYERAALLSCTTANYNNQLAEADRCKQKLEIFSSPDDL